MIPYIQMEMPPNYSIDVNFCKDHHDKIEVPDPLTVEDLISGKLDSKRKLARLITQYRDIFFQYLGRCCLRSSGCYSLSNISEGTAFLLQGVTCQLIRIFSLMNKNTQHFYCCSIVLAYSFRSWLQSTFPLIQFRPSLDTELFVNKCNRNIANELYLFLVNIAKPRRFKDMFVNKIINCCPSYATKTCHHVSWQSRPHTVPPESKLTLKILSCNNLI